MAETPFGDDWVDRYIRNELGPEEEAQFELRLMEDVELQAEVEAALGLREAVRLTQDVGEPVVAARATRSFANQWSPWAMAASVVLAVTTTLLAWRSGVENGRLQQELGALRAPVTAVLSVPVDIMRSSGGATPDVIIQLPADGAILLDIELSPALHNVGTVSFALQAHGAEPAHSWRASPDREGRAKVMLRTAQLPVGRVDLHMSNEDLSVKDTRLIEIRPARP